MTAHCGKCGTEAKPNARFCTKCGAALSSASADLGVKRLTDTDKHDLSAAVRDEAALDSPTLDSLNSYHKRMHQWAAQGVILIGFTQADMNWLHHEIEWSNFAWHKDCNIPGLQPPSPLEWKKGEDEATLAPKIEAVIDRIRERERDKEG